MPPRPSSATIRYRSTRRVPGENPPLCGGRELAGTGLGTTAFLSGSRVGVSRMDMARPHEAQNRTFSEHTAPQPEQVTMWTDCTPARAMAKQVVKMGINRRVPDGRRGFSIAR